MLRLLRWLKKVRSELKASKKIPVGLQGVREVGTNIYHKYDRNFDFYGFKVLNAGCGNCSFPAPNVTNLDFAEGAGIQVAHDLSKPLPFADNSFDLVIANHVLEHIPNWFDCFAELARVTKPGGALEVWVPTMGTDASFVYRDHINYMGLGSFCGASNLRRAGGNIEGNKHQSIKYLTLAEHNFRFIKEWWVILAPQPLQMWMSRHLRNIVSEEGFKFVKGEER